MKVKYAAHSITSGEWDFFETEAEALNWAEKEVSIELNDEGYSSDTCHGGIKIFKLIKQSRFIEEDRQSNYKCLKEPEELAQCSVCENSCGEGEEWPHDDEIDCVGRIEFQDVEE